MQSTVREPGFRVISESWYHMCLTLFVLSRCSLGPTCLTMLSRSQAFQSPFPFVLPHHSSLVLRSHLISCITQLTTRWLFTGTSSPQPRCGQSLHSAEDEGERRERGEAARRGGAARCPFPCNVGSGMRRLGAAVPPTPSKGEEEGGRKKRRVGGRAGVGA